MPRTLYTTPYCGYCDRVRSELERLKLEYEEVSVGWSLPDREEVLRLSGQRRVPILVENGEVIHDSSRILQHLRRKYAAR